MDGFVDEEALARRAALPGAEERGGELASAAAVDVRVLEDDQRAVAAELEQLRLAGGARRDAAARSRPSR